jgi:hypothetical protein
MLALWLTLAIAAPCGDLAAALRGAQEALDDAEVDVAASRLVEADAALLCQPEPVPAERLRELFGLQAVVALTQGRAAEAQVAAVRAVTTAPDSPPDAAFGPEVRALWDRWYARLASARVDVTVAGGGVMWLDGAPLAPGERRSVVLGEHVVQIVGEGPARGALLEITGPATLPTGLPERAPTPPVAPIVPEAAQEVPTESTESTDAPAPEVVAPPEVGVEVPAPEPAPADPGPAVSRLTRRPHPVALGVGLGAVVLGGGAAIAGAVAEAGFRDAAYDAETYGGCVRADDCYARERADRVAADAAGIRALYGVGYGLLGLGVVVSGASFAIAAPPGGVKLTVSMAF